MLRETKDDSLDPIDATAPTAATPSFALPEHRDIATVDGKVPVPAPSSPQFGDALGAKLSWMAERHIGHHGKQQGVQPGDGRDAGELGVCYS